MYRMRRGFLRVYLLKLIAEAESGLTGYDLMKKIEEETGFWRPSSGSIYPLLASFEAAGWITHRPGNRREKKIYTLTEKGEEVLQKANEARAEALEGMHRSIRVFAELFGEKAAQELSAPVFGEESHPIPSSLRRPLGRLRALLDALLREGLSEAEAEEIGRILERTSKELREYVKGN